ncbi:putative ADP-ribosylation factor [Apostichopus japonicus]|uniref:Putative ADP-ribosylation factor n=1 Tax=Stichopus japonicus TaxID=307972 RepID=A0A2G8JVL8_STIJA|nr:putative ADP-ribosylation factor [Apostichopus japonicus]
MGLLLAKLSSLYNDWFTYGPPTRVLLLGLDGAGKTTVMYKLKLNEVVTTIPTIGFNVEEITPVPGLTLTVWDVGGQETIRKLWRHYYIGAEGLIFVVDSTDVERFKIAREEIEAILTDDGIIRDIPFVVMANKQDLPGAVGPSKIIENLQLRNFRRNPWSIQGTCATTGEGLFEGMEMLSKMLKTFKKERS